MQRRSDIMERMKSFLLAFEHRIYAFLLSWYVLWILHHFIDVPLWVDALILNVGLFVLSWAFLEFRVHEP